MWLSEVSSESVVVGPVQWPAVQAVGDARSPLLLPPQGGALPLFLPNHRMRSIVTVSSPPAQHTPSQCTVFTRVGTAAVHAAEGEPHAQTGEGGGRGRWRRKEREGWGGGRERGPEE